MRGAILVVGCSLIASAGQAKTPADAPLLSQSWGELASAWWTNPRSEAYINFGARYFRYRWNFPFEKPAIPYAPLADHRLSLAPGMKPNPGADEAGWTPVQVDGSRIYFRAEYLLSELAGFNVDQEIAAARGTPADEWRRNLQISAASALTTLSSAKMHIAVFPMDQFRLNYYPGRYLLQQNNGSRSGRNLSVKLRGGIGWNQAEKLDRVSAVDQARLVGVFKGTFDNEDRPSYGALPGLLVDGVSIDKPLDAMATLAIYDDGKIAIGRYGSLPMKERIRSLRQNEYLLLENGNLATEGAFPDRWNRYGDYIIRSYLATSRDGRYMAYVWTTFCMPNLIAKAMQELGFSDMMLLDIHPACAFRSMTAADFGFMAATHFGSIPAGHFGCMTATRFGS